MGATLKKSAFYHTQSTIVALKTCSKSGFFSIEMNVPILAKMPAHGRNFEKVCFLSQSKHDCTFENLFKILIFSIEMNVPFWAKMSAHGRSFEKFCLLSHSKYDCSFENLFKILISSIDMNVPILGKMPAHGRSFEKYVFYHIQNTIVTLKTFSKS